MLHDSFGRIHDYLRISLTDHCNFRCSYCMPVEEMEWMPQSKLMSAQEIVKLAQVFVGLGVKKLRLTGGEPLARQEFPEILEQLSALPVELTLTTNGVLIHKHLDALKKARVRSINLSLDTLQPEKFFKLTRRDQFSQVWDNVQTLLQAGFRVKINAVALHGMIEEEVGDFVQLTEKLPIHVRFIEFMPFSGNHWQSKQVVTAAELLDLVRPRFEVIKLEDQQHDTALSGERRGRIKSKATRVKHRIYLCCPGVSRRGTFLQRQAAQAECVADHADRAQRHRHRLRRPPDVPRHAQQPPLNEFHFQRTP